MAVPAVPLPPALIIAKFDEIVRELMDDNCVLDFFNRRLSRSMWTNLHLWSFWPCSFSVHALASYYEKGTVISTSHLLSKFHVSEHIARINSKFCEQIGKESKNTLQQSTFPPSLTFTHPHHKQVVWHLWCMQMNKIFWHFDYLLVMQMVNIMQERWLL